MAHVRPTDNMMLQTIILKDIGPQTYALQQLTQVFRFFLREPSGTTEGVNFDPPANHWHFEIRPSPHDENTEYLHMANNPLSFAMKLHGGPFASLSLNNPDLEIAVQALLPQIFIAFVLGFEAGSFGLQSYIWIGPWSWGTSNADLAGMLGRAFKTVGLPEELWWVAAPASDGKYQYAEEQENADFEERRWNKYLGQLPDHPVVSKQEETVPSAPTPPTAEPICTLRPRTRLQSKRLDSELRLDMATGGEQKPLLSESKGPESDPYVGEVPLGRPKSSVQRKLEELS